MKIPNIRVCQTCVMDQTDPDIIFYDDETCSHCRHARRYASSSTLKRYPLEQVVSWIRQISSSSPDTEYDCIVGLSGGVDSTWLCHLLVQSGLRVYVHHVDTGWNTPKAVANIYRICNALNLNLHTHVLDWNQFRKIQQAYFYLGVINQDVPQDIAIFSSQILACKEHRISCLASGANNTTESILPRAWGHHWHDVANLRRIHSCFWHKNLCDFPFVKYQDLAAYRLNYHEILGIRTINVLDLVEYSKATALQILRDSYDYEEYPHKHGESSWTLYYQAIYLPSVYGIDKRTAHLSNLIVNGDLSRDLALEKLAQPSLSHATKMELANLVALKLGIPLEHALEPGNYVLPCSHQSFTATKVLIDQYTGAFFQAPSEGKAQVFSDYLRSYHQLDLP